MKTLDIGDDEAADAVELPEKADELDDERHEAAMESETGAGATGRLAQARRHAGVRARCRPALVDMIKQCVLDTLGRHDRREHAGAGGAHRSGIREGPRGQARSTLLGFGGRAPAPSAALLNGSLGHMLDYDDLGESGHPSIVTIPVALAVAEKLGGASGRELIAAVAAGTDVMTRLTQAISVPDWTMTEGWFATQLFGFIAGAVTAGRLMRLTEDQMENAIGIGFNQMSGTRQMAVGAATHMRSMQAGFSGQGAVMAAELARRGIIGSKEIVEGRYGIFKTYIRGTSRTGMRSWAASACAFRCWRSTASKCGRRAPTRGRPTPRRCTCGRSTACGPRISNRSP